MHTLQVVDQFATQTVADALTKICNANESRGRILTQFDSGIPTLHLADYIGRLKVLCNATGATVIAMYILIQRMCDEHLPLTWHNVFRLALGAFVIASKSTEDVAFRNSHYAVVGGVTTADMGQLERLVLRQLDWCTLVRSEEYNAVVRTLLWHVTNTAVHPSKPMVAAMPAPDMTESVGAAPLSPMCSACSSSAVSPASAACSVTPQYAYQPYTQCPVPTSQASATYSYQPYSTGIPAAQPAPAYVTHDPYSF